MSKAPGIVNNCAHGERIVLPKTRHPRPFRYSLAHRAARYDVGAGGLATLNAKAINVMLAGDEIDRINQLIAMVELV